VPLAGVLDLSDLGVRLLIRILLGLFVALCVLQSSEVERRQQQPQSVMQEGTSLAKAEEMPHDEEGDVAPYLRLKLLKFSLLLGAVRLDLLLCPVAGFPHPFCAVCSYVRRAVSRTIVYDYSARSEESFASPGNGAGSQWRVHSRAVHMLCR